MKGWNELFRIIQRCCIKMNFINIMFCLGGHWRAAIITAKTFHAWGRNIIFRCFMLAFHTPFKLIERNTDKSRDGGSTITCAIFAMTKACPTMLLR